MTPECFSDDSLPTSTMLSPDDPRRVHLDGCPRCRARVASYDCFLRADDVAGADLDDADARLSVTLGRPFASRPPRRAARVHLFPSGPGLWTLFATAATLAVALDHRVRRRSRDYPPPPAAEA